MCGCARIRQDITIKGLEYIKLPGTGNRLEDIQDVKYVVNCPKCNWDMQEVMENWKKR